MDKPLSPSLFAQEYQMVDKLPHACRLLHEILWRDGHAP
jgi:hypothetical protein